MDNKHCVLVFLLFVLLVKCESEYPRCNRVPHGVKGSKTAGDNGFRITLAGNPEKYIPGVEYTVTLHGWKTHNSVQKFIGFQLVVELANTTTAEDFDITNTGTFNLLGDSISKVSDSCPNAIVHTTNVAKSEIQLLWTAPEPKTGCVVFKASVVENKETWYKDDGSLTKLLCEEENETMDDEVQPPILQECCACDEAKFEVTFEGLWSRQTHPKDYPTNEWLTHFSDIIGASHSTDHSIWEYGGMASEGLRQVAEWGSSRQLESELKAESDHIRTIIKARGMWHPNLNGKTFAVFRVDKKHHLMSLVSMLGPSPDWIVGVSKLELCQKNCSWVTHKVLNLYPWDAGTDSGVTYMSVNAPSIPREKIRRITSTYPNNEKSPFFEQSGAQMKPVARLTISRQRLYEKSCDDNTVAVDLIPDFGNDLDERAECNVTEWSEFTQCSVTCGKGIQMRSREYTNKAKATMVGCDVQLVQKEMCAARQSSCDSEEIQTDSALCSVTKWSDWSECSVTCAKGVRSRSRQYVDRMARKICQRSLMDKESCMGQVEECEHIDQPDPQCAVTQWSEWSPCTVTCGKGMKVRTRLYFQLHNRSHCNVELMQKVPCMADKPDCTLDISEAKEVCMLQRDVGPCRGYFPRWYFESSKGMCLQFVYSGCRGNRNNFERYEDCKRMCEMMSAPITSLQSRLSSNIEEDQVQRRVDCMVSDWTAWSPCSVTCDQGRMERTRSVKVPPEYGGKACPKRLRQRKNCKLQPCAVDCILGDWESWSDCSRSCGQEGVQERYRPELTPATNGGKACGPNFARRHCTLPPCLTEE